MHNADRRAELARVFQFRHATKSFDATRKISDDDFAAVLDAARFSPTSFGLEPWRLVVVQDPDLRARLKDVSWGAQGQLPTASHYLVMTVVRGSELVPQGPYLTTMLNDIKKMPAENQQWMNDKLTNFFAEEVRLTSPELVTQWAARQAYIVLGNLMTAAAWLGIDSCPIEGFHQGKLEEVLHGHGGYDRTTHAAVCCVALGYRAQDPRPKSRKPLELSVGWA